MQFKKLPFFIAIIGLTALTFTGCKKQDAGGDPQTGGDTTLPDTAQTMFLGQKNAPATPTGPSSTTITAYDAATGTLTNTFQFAADANVSTTTAPFPFVSLWAGNGLLYYIESNKISAVNPTTGTVA